jgi:glycosyltransferase involved in cell wall biosynthesis
LILGIEASNLRRGGGITHLREILRAARAKEHGFDEVIVWSGRATLDELPPANDWLRLEHNALLEGGLPQRLWWQNVALAREARAKRCDLLFVPGGSYAGTFRPFVTMSRNMLPFEPRERARYGMSAMRAKLTILERVQSASMRRADGVIFLNEYAKKRVTSRAGALRGRTTIIPHGVDDRFRIAPRSQRPIVTYDREHPFRLLYVSIIDVYKHQDIVAEAVARLRARGLPVEIDFRGPSYAAAQKRLNEVVARVDPRHEFIHADGVTKYADLPAVYAAADAFVFASSCENMPNILLEAMAAGLPIASSSRGPMPEILGDGGVLFDPENVEDVEAAIALLVNDHESRARWALAAYERASRYSWSRCAEETFGFLAEVVGMVVGARSFDSQSQLR